MPTTLHWNLLEVILQNSPNITRVESCPGTQVFGPTQDTHCTITGSQLSVVKPHPAPSQVTAWLLMASAPPHPHRCLFHVYCVIKSLNPREAQLLHLSPHPVLPRGWTCFSPPMCFMHTLSTPSKHKALQWALGPGWRQDTHRPQLRSLGSTRELNLTIQPGRKEKGRSLGPRGGWTHVGLASEPQRKKRI